MSLATVEDLAVRVPGGIPTADEQRAQAYLDDASAMIEEEVGRTFSDVPPTARRICLSVAQRAWFNPAFVSSEQLGDFNTSYAARGGVYLTAEEKADLGKLKASASLWVQPLGRHDRLVHPREDFVYVQDQGGGLPLAFVPDELP